MLIIVGTVRLPVENLDKARHAMMNMIEASRKEAGCIGYSYAEDIVEPGLIRVMELWRDREALDRHFASAHLKEWRASWSQLGIRDRDLQLFEAGMAQPI